MNDGTHMVVYGKQPVREALFSDHPIIQLILAREMPPKERDLFQRLAGQRRIPVELRTKGELQRYCGPVLHQGIAALMEPYRYADEDRLWQKIDQIENPLLLILDQIQDPHNLGAILRTAEVVGVSGVVLPSRGSAEVNATVAKTSSGAIFHLTICRTDNMNAFFDTIRHKKLLLVALSPGRPDTIYGFDMDRPMAVIIGSEGKGVRKNLQNLADKTLSIPQKGKMGSLNASTSTAVILFEIFRQREFGSRK